MHHGDGGAFLGRGEGSLQAQHAAAQHHHALAAGHRIAEDLGVAQVAQRSDAGGQDGGGRVRVDAR